MLGRLDNVAFYLVARVQIDDSLLAHVLAGSPGLEWYLLREQRYMQTDIEAECARIATLVCFIKNLERGTQSD